LESKNNITGIILSGGQSIRMGENKAFIKIEGVPIIRRIHGLFERIFNEIIIVANQKEEFATFGAKICSDLFPNRGVLGGLYTGLFFSSFEYSFCAACDMPFLKESVIRYLIERIDDYDVIVPKTNEGLEPLHAIYSKNCLDPIRKVIEEGKYKIFDFYPMVKTKIVEEYELIALDSTMESFINVNTPEELISIKRRKPSY
jgi:molybdopterin-guanine dinucleotide biosynthesis protein A